MAHKKKNTNAGSSANDSRKRGRDGKSSSSNGPQSKTQSVGAKAGKNKKSMLSPSSSLLSFLSGSSYGQRLTAGGVIILIVAIVAGVVLNEQDAAQVDPTLRSFWPVVCSLRLRLVVLEALIFGLRVAR